MESTKVHGSPSGSTLPHSSQGRIQKKGPGLTSPPKAISLPGTTGHPRPLQPRVFLFSLKCWWILENQILSRSEPWLCCHLCPEFFLCLYDGHSYSFSWVTGSWFSLLRHCTECIAQGPAVPCTAPWADLRQLLQVPTDLFLHVDLVGSSSKDCQTSTYLPFYHIFLFVCAHG